MQRQRYQQVVTACALDHDLRAMPAGDLSPVGDAGSRLSGGQRARLALARAVYQASCCRLATRQLLSYKEFASVEELQCWSSRGAWPGEGL